MTTVSSDTHKLKIFDKIIPYIDSFWIKKDGDLTLWQKRLCDAAKNKCFSETNLTFGSPPYELKAFLLYAQMCSDGTEKCELCKKMHNKACPIDKLKRWIIDYIAKGYPKYTCSVCFSEKDHKHCIYTLNIKN